jgi:anti-anti-sigma factor
MQIVKSIQGPIAILSLKGPLVADELPVLQQHVEDCSRSGVFRLVLDLKDTPFIDSAALEKIQNIASDMGKRGGDVRIACPNEVCRDIFVATRIGSFVQVLADKEAATRSLL